MIQCHITLRNLQDESAAVVEWSLESAVLEPESAAGHTHTAVTQIGGAMLRLETIFSQGAVEGVSEKRLRITHSGGSPVQLLKINLGEYEADDPGGWREGGTGQPAFCGDKRFVCVRHPHGIVEVSDDAVSVSLYQHPGAILQAGQSWESAAAVIGRSEGLISAQDLLNAYIERIAKFAPQRVNIYGDWALHDELAEPGRAVELTEEMTRENIKLLARMREEYGVRFDYYLIDHGWYGPDSFLEVKKPNFQQAGLRWVADELQTMGMGLGLWYPVNTYQMRETYCGLVPAEPAEGGRGQLCMHSAYGKHLREAMLYAVSEWNVKLIKLDFADFDCGHPDVHGLAGIADETLLNRIMAEQECDALLDALKQIRSAHPDVLIVAFNGFVPSPWWLETIDTLYIGDVQPSDVPATRLRTSINMYTAKHLERYERSHVPRPYLDDCGTFLGETTTNFYIGAEDWRSQAMLCFGRGVALQYYYGDFRLLNEDDLQFLGRLFAFDEQNGGFTAGVRTYGDLDGNGLFMYLNPAYAAVFNPTLQRIHQTLGGVSCNVGPYEAQWIDLRTGAVIESSGAVYPDGERIDPVQTENGSDRCKVAVNRYGGTWVYYLSFIAPDGEERRSRRPKEQCRVASNYPFRVVPDTFVWNGVSWLAVAVDVPAAGKDVPWLDVMAAGDFAGCEMKGASWWIP